MSSAKSFHTVIELAAARRELVARKFNIGEKQISQFPRVNPEATLTKHVLH